MLRPTHWVIFCCFSQAINWMEEEELGHEPAPIRDTSNINKSFTHYATMPAAHVCVCVLITANQIRKLYSLLKFKLILKGRSLNISNSARLWFHIKRWSQRRKNQL